MVPKPVKAPEYDYGPVITALQSLEPIIIRRRLIPNTPPTSTGQPVFGGVIASDLEEALRKLYPKLDLQGAGAVFTLPAIGGEAGKRPYKVTGQFVVLVTLRNDVVVRVKFNVIGGQVAA